jgi:hypothetical protein
LDRPKKIKVSLQIDSLAALETYVIPISKGSLAGEASKNITIDIVGNIVL